MFEATSHSNTNAGSRKGTTHPDVKLAALLDAYVVEAEAKLVEILNFMRMWPWNS